MSASDDVGTPDPKLPPVRSIRPSSSGVIVEPRIGKLRPAVVTHVCPRVSGRTGLDGVLADVAPVAVTAVTVNVYVVPLANPVTRAIVVDAATVTVVVAGVDVTS